MYKLKIKGKFSRLNEERNPNVFRFSKIRKSREIRVELPCEFRYLSGHEHSPPQAASEIDPFSSAVCEGQGTGKKLASGKTERLGETRPAPAGAFSLVSMTERARAQRQRAIRIDRRAYDRVSLLGGWMTTEPRKPRRLIPPTCAPSPSFLCVPYPRYASVSRVLSTWWWVCLRVATEALRAVVIAATNHREPTYGLYPPAVQFVSLSPRSSLATACNVRLVCFWKSATCS
ncbi:uncharacterized protein LOC120357984 [Solenopsis invicta]|uniref:uncharacterized protein LOC120357984 n=1 Tax=Solenopsis invicta TaxID=13686 RepID=UPI00193CE08B|nr:uncharacterized protein LOC120357984 [Solenopsis invicta]